MAKTKHLKYQRVKTLPNVVLPDIQEPPWPWEDPAVAGMKKVLELGCGKGEHSIGFAAEDPGRLYIGVDLKSHRICNAGEAAAQRPNLFFLRSRVEDLDSYLGAGTVDEIWITFPDPHPKKREIKHRLTAPGFLALYARLMVAGGCIHLKTDSALLFDYTRAVVAEWGGAIRCETPDLHGNGGDTFGAPHICSAFEKKALSRGKTVTYIRFTLT